MKVRVCVIALLLAVVGVSAAAAAPNHYTPRHGKPCRKGYKKVFRRVHHLHHRHATLIRICVKRAPAAQPLTATKAAKLHAHLDPTFTRNPLDPFEVTYDYSASATQEVTDTASSLTVQEPAPLPAGVLALYSDGKLECAINVGGVIDSSRCPVDYAALGKHQVTTIYASGEQSATETETESIEPIPTATSVEAVFSRVKGPVEYSKERLGTLLITYGTSFPGSAHLVLAHSGEQLHFWSTLQSPTEAEVLLEINYHGKQCSPEEPECEDHITYEAVIKVPGAGEEGPFPFSYFEDGLTILTASRPEDGGYLTSSHPQTLRWELESVRQGT